MRKIVVRAIAAAAVLVLGAATAGVIDFESVPVGTYSSVTDQGVTFTFSGGTGTFDVTPSGSPGWPISGNALISYFQNPDSSSPFKATMAGGFSSFAIGCGDYNQDDDECHLEAYDALGNLLDTDYLYVDPSTYGGGMLSVASASVIDHVLFYETGSYAGAVYWDNAEFTAAAVPEPQTWAFMVLGLAGIAGVARRRQAK